MQHIEDRVKEKFLNVEAIARGLGDSEIASVYPEGMYEAMPERLKELAKGHYAAMVLADGDADEERRVQVRATTISATAIGLGALDSECLQAVTLATGMIGKVENEPKSLLAALAAGAMYQAASDRDDEGQMYRRANAIIDLVMNASAVGAGMDVSNSRFADAAFFAACEHYDVIDAKIEAEEATAH